MGSGVYCEPGCSARPRTAALACAQVVLVTHGGSKWHCKRVNGGMSHIGPHPKNDSPGAILQRKEVSSW